MEGEDNSHRRRAKDFPTATAQVNRQQLKCAILATHPFGEIMRYKLLQLEVKSKQGDAYRCLRRRIRQKTNFVQVSYKNTIERGSHTRKKIMTVDVGSVKNGPYFHRICETPCVPPSCAHKVNGSEGENMIQLTIAPETM
jgi:hypothetical protein